MKIAVVSKCMECPCFSNATCSHPDNLGPRIMERKNRPFYNEVVDGPVPAWCPLREQELKVKLSDV